MQKFNYHGHTYRCKHADMTISDEEYVKLFIKHGFKKIAFTDHCPQREVVDTRQYMRMEYNQKEEYYNSIRSLKEKYKDKIDIEMGFEVEYLPGMKEYLLELKKETDKIILGQHFIYNDNKDGIYIFRYHNFTDKELIRYGEYLEEAMKLGIPDIIAHPDIYMLGRKEFANIEEKVAHIVCKAAEKYQIPLEINLTEIVIHMENENSKISYPCVGFWKIASNYNVKVIYGVDAHFRDQIELYEESVKWVNEYLGKEIISKLNFVDEKL